MSIVKLLSKTTPHKSRIRIPACLRPCARCCVKEHNDCSKRKMNMGRGTDWHHNRGFSLSMGLIILGILILVFTKGSWVLPFIVLFSFITWRRQFGSSRAWADGCEVDEHMKRKNEAFDKRKN